MLQPICSTNDNAIFSCKMLIDHACIDGIIKREDSQHAFNICSMTHDACAWIVLLYAFISIDQLEKRAHTLFAGGNID